MRKYSLDISEAPRIKKQDLELFYKSSNEYLKELNTHDELYLNNYIRLVSKYISGGQRILDLGCGNGKSAYLLSKLNKLNLVVGCDISFKFLNSAHNLIKENLKYITTDVTSLPFKDNQVDIIASFQLIEHISEVETMLCEMARVLKKNGMIIIMSPNLLSPFPVIRGMLSKLLKKKTNGKHHNSLCRDLYLLIRNIFTTLNKLLSNEIRFLFRSPSLIEGELFPDSDSIYLANQVDIKKFLKRRGFKIINVAKGMSFAGLIAEKLFPDFCGEIGIIAKKVI